MNIDPFDEWWLSLHPDYVPEEEDVDNEEDY
jgi:hypothetical protein